MDRRLRRVAAACLLPLMLAAGCADDDGDAPSPAPSAGTPTGRASPSPSVTRTVPADLIPLEGGEATVALTGDVEDTLELSIDADQSHYDPGTSTYELRYDAGGETLTITVTVAIPGTEVEDAAVAVGAPGATTDDERYFFEPDDRCDVRLSRADPAGIFGSFECTGLENAGGDLAVDASGTFSASA